LHTLYVTSILHFHVYILPALQIPYEPLSVVTQHQFITSVISTTVKHRYIMLIIYYFNSLFVSPPPCRTFKLHSNHNIQHRQDCTLALYCMPRTRTAIFYMLYVASFPYFFLSTHIQAILSRYLLLIVNISVLSHSTVYPVHTLIIIIIIYISTTRQDQQDMANRHICYILIEMAPN
jgi:hypothetical protein